MTATNVNPTTLPDFTARHDEMVQSLLDYDYTQMPEGVSEAMSSGEYDILVSRDCFRADTHFAVSVLRQGVCISGVCIPMDDLLDAIRKAGQLTRPDDAAVARKVQADYDAGYANLA